MAIRIALGSFEIDLSRRGVLVSRVGAVAGQWDVYGHAMTAVEATAAGHSWWFALVRGALGTCGPATRLVLCGMVHDFYAAVERPPAGGMLR